MRAMGDSTPICRCRVLYLGSAVPRQSKDGLQGIQEPLRSLYPSEGAVGAKGIDSWLSVWSNGILLENVDENRKQVTRFFPIDSLHYCAAVRQVLIPERGNSNPEPKFLPLDSPFARMPRAQHPPIFAGILRRTTGIKVLECHVFICKREAAANALVRCCFHAYADNSYARQLEGGTSTNGGGGGGGGGSGGNGSMMAAGSSGSVYGTLMKSQNGSAHDGWSRSRAGSTTTMNSVGRHTMRPPPMNGDTVSDAFTVKNIYASSADLDVVDDGEGSIYNGDENHKVWTGSTDRLDGMGLEGPYDFYSSNGAGPLGVGSSSTLGRPARARQISAPMPVPPPPASKDETSKRSKKVANDKKLKYNGGGGGGGSQSLSGTLIRPKPVHASTLTRHGPHHPMHGHHHGPPPLLGPHMYMYGPPPPVPVGPPRQFHTFSHRAFANQAAAAGMNGPNVGGGGMGQMPQMAMSMMIPTQYATLQPPRSSKLKKKHHDKMHGMPLGMPVATPLFAYPPPSAMMGPGIGEPRPLAMSNRKLAQSAAAGLDEVPASQANGAESPGGTGIYRRKGHLNERAFSYSIRQEHRSRSHGSLASLQFNPPDMKKEREIAQMVAGLDLNPSGNGGGSSMANGGGGTLNGNSHHGMGQETSTLNRRPVPGGSGTFGRSHR